MSKVDKAKRAVKKTKESVRSWEKTKDNAQPIPVVRLLREDRVLELEELDNLDERAHDVLMEFGKRMIQAFAMVGITPAMVASTAVNVLVKQLQQPVKGPKDAKVSNAKGARKLSKNSRSAGRR